LEHDTLKDKRLMNKTVNINNEAKSLISQGRLPEAKELLLKAYQCDFSDSGTLLGLGVINAREGDFINAEKWLGMAAEAAPNNPNIHIHMANTLSRLQKHDEAISHYQIAISINPDIFEAHYFLAGLLLPKKHLEEAEHHYIHAIKLNSKNPDCHANLAQLYELTHRLKDARNAASQALQLKSDHIGALMLMGKLEKREKHYTGAERMFQKVLASATDESLIASVSTELGHVFDKMGRYYDAWDAFSTGKSTWKSIAADIPFDKHEYQKRIQLNTQSLSKSSIAQWQKIIIPDDTRPAPVFFVGFPRSGTTLTEQILAQYPHSVTSNEAPLLQKTIESIPAILDTSVPYPDCLEAMSLQDIIKLRDTYWHQAESRLSTLQYNSLLIDKLPLNIVDLGFIARVFPDSHVLVAIRDPRDTCLSCFMQAFQLNPAMINFLDMKSTVSFYTQVMDLWLHYRSVLPIHWHQYRYEDLVGDFDKTTQSIFNFLGLDAPANLDKFHESARRKFIDTPSYQDVTTPIYNRSMARWKNYNKQIEPYLNQLVPFTKEFGYL
jgi:tetratricopeptide (TPR) repeat protein